MTTWFATHFFGGAFVFGCVLAVILFVILPLAVLGRGPCCRIMLALAVALAVSPAVAKDIGKAPLAVKRYAAATPLPRPTPTPERNLHIISRAQATSNPLDVLKLIPFVLDDVTAAKEDADAQKPPDVIASACWGAIITFIDSNPVINPLPTGLGAAQLVQKARDLAALAAQLKSPTGPLAPLKMGCGALIVDTQTDMILGLGALLGLVR